jgi:hypothetical protein
MGLRYHSLGFEVASTTRSDPLIQTTLLVTAPVRNVVSGKLPLM